MLHGDDWGLVRSRADIAIQAVLATDRNPFRRVVLNKESHGRVLEEVSSRSLGGGRKIIHVLDGSDQLAAGLAKLTDQDRSVLIIIEAPALPPRSKLRSIAEARPDCAAIACYPERAQGVAEDISTTMRAAGCTVDREALDFLTAELSGDSLRRRSELQKLALFAHGQASITLKSVETCCCSQTEMSVTAAVSAALAGRLDECDLMLEELRVGGATGPGVIAVLGMEVHRLFRARSQLADGKRLEDVLARMHPPVFPSQVAAFSSELRRWSQAALLELGVAIHDADLACKRGSSAGIAIASNLLLQIARRSAASTP